MYKFSVLEAGLDEPAVWELQNFLLSKAEELFGIKDPAKKIYQPIFRPGQPHIINTPNYDGAFASLSEKASIYWPTTLYELAHETVHLLNPIVGHTNYLEEGFAVLFSVDMSKKYTDTPQKPDCPFYNEAWSLVCRLSDNPYEAATAIRREFGSLGAANAVKMAKIFPNVAVSTIQKLCSVCDFT